MGVRPLFYVFGGRAGLAVTDFCRIECKICNRKCNTQERTRRALFPPLSY